MPQLQHGFRSRRQNEIQDLIQINIIKGTVSINVPAVQHHIIIHNTLAPDVPKAYRFLDIQDLILHGCI